MQKYCFFIIKGVTVGRGWGPDVLGELVNNSGLQLVQFKATQICNNTLTALCAKSTPDDVTLDPVLDVKTVCGGRTSWVGIMSSENSGVDAIATMAEFCGPPNLLKQNHRDLRFRYGGHRVRKSEVSDADNAIHYSTSPDRFRYEAKFFFEGLPYLK